jgi:Right handed beta helix region
MSKLRFTLHTFALLTLMLVFTSAANAQATRTFVSGVGDDVNPCSRTAPCKTFAGAISKTAVNGEINVLDPGGFGGLTITKSLTVDGRGTMAGQLASSIAGVTINLTTAPASDPLGRVTLRYLNINGTGSCGVGCGTRTGTDGIRIITPSTGTVQPEVIVENVTIENFTQSGIDWSCNGGHLMVRDSKITNNTLHGIFVDSSANLVRVSIDNTTADFNQEGIRFDDNVRGTISRSTVASNLNGFVCLPSGTGNSEMNISESTSTNNTQWGVVAGSTGAFSGAVRLFNNTITNNTVLGLETTGTGTIVSNGRNHITTPTDAPGIFTDQ